MPFIITAILAAVFLISCAGGPRLVNGEYEVYKSEAAKKEMMELYADTLSLWPVPFAETDVETSWGKTHVIISGPAGGRPLVLLGGANSTAPTWFTSIRELSRTHRVYAVDTIGDCGKSRAVRLPETPKDYADWLNEVFTGLSLSRASLVGASYGGFIVQWFVHYYPARSERAALFSFAPMEKGVAVTTIIRMIYYVIFSSETNIRRAVSWYNNGPMKDRKFEDMAVMMFYKIYKNANAHIIVPTFLSASQLAAVTAPLLVVLGEQDVIYEAEKSRAFCAKANPAIRFEIVKGAGHMLVPDHTDRLNGLLREFLK